jgi:hypothetical protein
MCAILICNLVITLVIVTLIVVMHYVLCIVCKRYQVFVFLVGNKVITLFMERIVTLIAVTFVV